MRLVVSLVFFAACHAPNAPGPAWPAPSTTADDGGESIAPASTMVAASVEKSADAAKEEPKAAAEDKPEPAVTEDKTPTIGAPQPTPATDDILMTDDLIIEIED